MNSVQPSSLRAGTCTRPHIARPQHVGGVTMDCLPSRPGGDTVATTISTRTGGVTDSTMDCLPSRLGGGDTVATIVCI